MERKISLAITSSLVDTRITPNAMTLLSVGIGIIGASFFASPKKSRHVLGALLFWLHSVLDGCDGELARLKFAESRWGGLIDFWGDNVVHSAVFSAIAAGVYAKEAKERFRCAGFFGSERDAAVRGFGVSENHEGQDFRRPALYFGRRLALAAPKFHRTIADQLARRDFIYLVIALAIAGKVNWFLRMGAIGAPLYFLALAALSLKNSQAARQQIVSPETLK